MRISDWSSDLCSSDLFMLGQYYRFQWSSLLSFGHRLTGIGLTFGTALLAIWLIAIAAGPQWYDAVSPHLHAWYGQVLLICWTWALMYHLRSEEHTSELQSLLRISYAVFCLKKKIIKH